jgi:selenide,water dikinase
MDSSPLALTRDIVLVGGGHTHALVLRSWAMNPLPGARLTVINPEPTAAYSGMLPGHIAGHYPRAALDIDLVRLAQFAGARLVLGRAEGIDRDARQVRIAEGPAVGYDVLSLDVGVTSTMPRLPGFEAFGHPAKPLGPFAEAWQAYLDGAAAVGVVVLGGGIAGVELAMAMRHRLTSEAREVPVTIVEKDRALAALGPSARRKLLQSLRDEGVTLREGCTVTRVGESGVALADGTEIAADFVVGTAGAAAHPWLAASELANEEGFVTVNARLQSRDPSVFAVGDCAHLAETPRPKAGVYAVRQAPVLLHNLRAAATGAGGLKPYRAQKDYLKLVSLGRKAAQAERFGIALSSPALWTLKDRIDRKFMDRLNTLPPPERPVRPWPRAAGAAPGAAERCGGCGAKLGAGALSAGLSHDAPGDDAAILTDGGETRVMSTDHLRGFIADPAAMARIAAVHALGDIWAMGGQPRAATATLILPNQSDRLAQRHVREIMHAARAVMAAAGAEIVGGHTTLGAEMTIGFTITGACTRPPITLAGAQAGDRLVLTKPVGTGVIMAAHMRWRAEGAHVAGALAQMMQPQHVAARLLAEARAMTDVTGFGLAGHLRAICIASGVGARLEVARVPLLPGAEAYARAGVRSSLFAENAAGFPAPETARAALMFDPQTSGGLLAAVPGDAEALCASLRDEGIAAAVIGEITDVPGQVDMV